MKNIAKEDAAAGGGGVNLALLEAKKSDEYSSTNEGFFLFRWIGSILNYIKAWICGLTATVVIIFTLSIHLILTTLGMAIKAAKRTFVRITKSPVLMVSILGVVCVAASTVFFVAMASVPVLLFCSPLLIVGAFFSPFLIFISIPILIAALAFAFVTFSSTAVLAGLALGVCAAAFGVVGLPCDLPRLLYSSVLALWDKGCTDSGGADPVGNFAINFICTAYRYLIPPLPVPPPSAVNTKLGGLTVLPFREPCAHYAPDSAMLQEAGDRYNGEVWIYINGIATTKDIADSNRALLFEMFGRPIHLVHNPTDSILVDLIECLSFKVGLLDTFTSFQSLVHRVPEDVLENTLEKFLNDDSVTKVVLMAHSQGTIVTGNTLNSLLKKDTRHKMQSKLEVYNFANCAHDMPGAPGVKYLENISNGGDIVAWLGHLFVKVFKPFHALWIDADGNSLQISGKSVIERYLWGHLLNTHYLLPMKNRDMYTGMVDGPLNMDDNRSKLVQYMKEHKRLMCGCLSKVSSAVTVTKEKMK